MSKISTYNLADTPLQLSDRLIGTEAPRPTPTATPLATKNFSLGELLQLFSSNFPAASLQAVLDTNNTATEDINLTGTINTTLIKPGNIIDMLNSQGTPLQILSKGVGGICWIDGPNLSGYVPTSRELTINGVTYDLSANRSWTIGTGVQNLQEVTDEGNETTNPLIVISNNGFDENKAYIGPTFIEVSNKDIALNETTRVTLENSGIRRYNIVDGGYMLDLTDASNAVPSTETRLLKAPILISDAIIATTDDIGTWGALDYPAWTTGTPFVKMTAAGTFSLDTNTYLTSADLTGFVPYTGATQNVNLGEFELKAGQLTLDISPTGTAVVGTTRWNNSIGTSETTLKGGSVILKNGVDLVARVVNKVTPNTTLTKANYAAVRISGAQGQRLAVAYAQANNDNNSADTIGLVTETIPTNQEGFILTVGQLEDINTTGSLQGETWNDGDVLYLSPTIPGSLTNIKPSAPGHIVVIGYVEYAHNNNGKIYVKIMNGWELDELHNVAISTPLNNQALVYETSTQLWKNKTIIQDSITDGVTEIAPSQNAVFDALATKQNVLTNPITGTGANGQVAFFNGTTTQSGDNGLFWDNTNKRLGVGTISPSFALDVNGGARVQTNFTIGLTTNNSGSRTVFNGSTAGRSFQIANNWNIGNSFEITPSTTVAGSIFTTPALVVNGTTSNVGIGTTSPQSRLDVRAQGALSTDIAFRVRNSADTANLISVDGIGQTIITPSALTGTSATSALDIAQTWNTTGTPTLISANVTDTASNTNSNLIDLRVGNVSRFSVTKSGIVWFGSTTNFSHIIPFGTSQADARLQITAGIGGAVGSISLFQISTNNPITSTSNNPVLATLFSTFSPTSGTATHSILRIASTINQTGGANGITRGLFINPTLTSAFDFRAIEVTGGKLVFSSTITPIGTTGAQTINRISGKINAAAGTTSLVVTNSLVTTSSIVMCQLGTNDATCAVRSVVEANGSFTINYTAPTAETVIKFTVIN